MNQILSVNNNTKKNGKKAKSSTHSILVVFAVILMIFGIGLTSTGAYSYYMSLSNGQDDSIASVGSTKPVITTERENASIVNIVVTHDKGIASLTYKINDEEPVEVDGDNKMEIKQEVELPEGNPTLTITAKDINGVSSSYENTYEVDGKPTIVLEQVEGQIKATIEGKNNIDYIMYYWDEDENNGNKMTINSPKTETLIDVMAGTHTLNVVAVDVNGGETKKSQKIIGDNKPNVEIKTNGKVFRIMASDDESIEKIEYTFNSENKQTEQVGQKEYTKDLELKSGKNNLTVTVYNKNGLSNTTTVEYVKE